MKRRRCVPESGRLRKGQNGVDGYRGVLYDSGGRQQRRALGGESIEIRGGKAMQSFMRVFVCAMVLVGAGAITSLVMHQPAKAQAAKAQAPVATDHQKVVARGKYLVTEVAKCQECHTPRDSNGNEDDSRWLQGAPVWIMPVHHTSNWAMNAPAIAGFLGFTDQDGYKIFEQGIGPNGITIRPPMHIYHMNHEDAVAIIAYLRSLPAPPQ
jgi:mono/diheme cytochrome c family protein